MSVMPITIPAYILLVVVACFGGFYCTRHILKPRGPSGTALIIMVLSGCGSLILTACFVSNTTLSFKALTGLTILVMLFSVALPILCMHFGITQAFRNKHSK